MQPSRLFPNVIILSWKWFFFSESDLSLKSGFFLWFQQLQIRSGCHDHPVWIASLSHGNMPYLSFISGRSIYNRAQWSSRKWFTIESQWGPMIPIILLKIFSWRFEQRAHALCTPVSSSYYTRHSFFLCAQGCFSSASRTRGSPCVVSLGAMVPKKNKVDRLFIDTDQCMFKLILLPLTKAADSRESYS